MSEPPISFNPMLASPGAFMFYEAGWLSRKPATSGLQR